KVHMALVSCSFRWIKPLAADSWSHLPTVPTGPGTRRTTQGVRVLLD
uniref:Collagen type IV alpha 4 chain n=1 Tax=Sus scrofa TaxID=9823 RepID=A0A8W4F900_PIG